MKTLQGWLPHLETIYSSNLIDVGLEHVGEVRKRVNLVPQCSAVVVAGTNGKSFVCAYLSYIYKEVGFKVDILTNPHLLRYNERIAINTQSVSNDLIVSPFKRIGAAHGEISLTYLEFNALATINIFIREDVNVMILEVGLDGRLDIVSIFDGNCPVVTSVDLDHQASSGDTVKQVGLERVGVFRSGKSAVYGQSPAPESLVKHAEEIDAKLLTAQRDFDFASMESVQ